MRDTPKKTSSSQKESSLVVDRPTRSSTGTGKNWQEFPAKSRNGELLCEHGVWGFKLVVCRCGCEKE
ncbi:hypothetical protein CEXT_265011 [Caerostris extrusa]|uniref:Uncharacterized protein n=1 Tax=Caerostris extrusa TaxID=172846 RepID=A0AAV4NVL6_CAEEX|nr:hypothetical protein CEXT_265011 [Caerostris extrusa]